MQRKGHVGYDIHKNAKPEVAESGGVSIAIGISIGSILLIIFFPVFLNKIILFFLTVLLAAVIGFIDDRMKLKSRYKIILTIFAGAPIFIAVNFFDVIQIQSPILPFLGRTRLTIIYPLMLPIIVSVFTNVVNMLEGYNGEGSGTCLIAISALLICSLIMDSAEGLIFSAISIATLVPFFLFNKYPSKVFPGDVGTLCLGAIISCIAILGSLEVAAFCAILIHIFNGFYVISSVKGFFESSTIMEEKSDIILLEDGNIKASDRKNAALSLPRLILAKGPLTELNLVKNFYAISIICGLFSVISVILIQYTIEKMTLITVLTSIFILFIPIPVLMYLFPRIRGFAVLLLLFLAGASICLMFIDLLIVPLPFEDIVFFDIFSIPVNIALSFIIICAGLILCYIIAIRHFWFQIKRIT
jgi:UDP-N-acetylglucosamine--dolichyl-phosphate N-acetylglucosaminephosphotransferase